MICSTDPNELMSAKKIKINIANDDNVLTENMIRSPIIIDDWYTASSASKDPEYHDKLNVSFVCNFLLLPPLINKFCECRENYCYEEC